MKKYGVLLLIFVLLQLLLSAAAEEVSDFPKPGDIFVFGHYEQDNDPANGAEPIEWEVLDAEGSNLLLISRFGLDAKPYNEGSDDITWEECTLRSWLNSDFLNTAFSEKEQEKIVCTHVDNSEAQAYGEAQAFQGKSDFTKWETTGGEDTDDMLFLLSCAEAYRYFEITRDNRGNVDARVQPTAYAQAQGARNWWSGYRTKDGEKSWWWWLRSPGVIQSFSAMVQADGTLSYISADYGKVCVRPALWLALKG